MGNIPLAQLPAAAQHAACVLPCHAAESLTFLDFDIEYKDGVDPNFLFDIKLHQSQKHRFFNVKSNEFWLSDKPQIYDIFFIDGLHTFEQTLRDIICSLKYSHNQSIWLIDDTVPSDIFSAIKDQKQSYYVRSSHKMPGKPWHGDVFKIIRNNMMGRNRTSGSGIYYRKVVT